jgi:MFS transporter, DHA1 family, tetracycline resistance protein
MRFGWGGSAIGWALAWVGSLTVLVQATLADRMVARLGGARAGALGLASAAVALAAYAFVTEGWQVYAVFLLGLLGAFAYPALSGLVSRWSVPIVRERCREAFPASTASPR